MFPAISISTTALMSIFFLVFSEYVRRKKPQWVEWFCVGRTLAVSLGVSALVLAITWLGFADHRTREVELQNQTSVSNLSPASTQTGGLLETGHLSEILPTGEVVKDVRIYGISPAIVIYKGSQNVASYWCLITVPLAILVFLFTYVLLNGSFRNDILSKYFSASSRKSLNAAASCYIVTHILLVVWIIIFTFTAPPYTVHLEEVETIDTTSAVELAIDPENIGHVVAESGSTKQHYYGVDNDLYQTFSGGVDTSNKKYILNLSTDGSKLLGFAEITEP